jgi:bla regulator protein blaR1
MPALFIYLLKVNIALLVFCAGYYLVLRRLTFYTLNRIYLVGAIAFASVYSRINLWDFFERHRQIARPVQALVIDFRSPARAFIQPLTQPNYWRWAETVFWLVAALFALRLLIQFISLYRIYRKSSAAHLHGHRVRIIEGDGGPFSFWKNIYVNPAMHEPADLKAILMHEQVHVNEWHTLDILLAELSVIFYWFNPGIWLMKKAIRENIEFITDRKILQNGADTKQYQYSLVNVSFAASPGAIVNHFNISTIKKRIIMMNAKRSSKFNLTRYALLVPAVVALLLVFSISKAALTKKSAVPIKKAAQIKAEAKSTKTVSSAATIGTGIVAKTDKKDIAKANHPALTAIAGTDTNKKGTVYIKTTEESDSLTYVINGIKADKAAFKTLDPDHIYSIEILNGEQAQKALAQLDGKHNVLFVTTDDSEAGKKFKEKLDQLNETAEVSFHKMKNGYHISYLNSPDEIKSVNGNWVVVADGDSTRRHPGDSLKHMSYSINAINGKPGLTYTVNNLKYSPRPELSFNTESTIDNFSNKLIIINGKEATQADLKKLSAFDIDRMVLKTDEETRQLYGDRAKNGVVFILTKKKN